jgi:serine/threonine protein kinase
MDLGRFSKGTLLASDSFVCRYEAIDSSTNEKVEVNVFVGGEWDASKQRNAFRFLEILTGNTHPATSHLIGFSFNFSTENPVEIATEFQPNGSLGMALARERNGEAPILDATQKSKIIFGIVAGMAYLHRRDVLYRDLKPNNILLNAQFEPVIGGFDISRFYDGGVNLTMNVGTVLYMAPEMLAGDDGYDFGIDVYSFAVVLYSIFAECEKLDDGTSVRGTSFQFCRAVLSGVRFVKDAKIPESHWELIESCWRSDPKTRPTFQQLLDSFRGGHRYVLEGADLNTLLEYEQKVGGSNA